jgi:hypothetical protein
MSFFKEIEKKKNKTKYMNEYFKKNPEQYKKQLERGRQYRSTPEYKQKRKEYDKKYLQNNPDRRRESCKKYSRLHPEVGRRTVANYIKNHPDRHLAQCLKAQSRLGSIMNMTGFQYRNMCIKWTNAVKKRDSNLCQVSIQPEDQRLINSITGIKAHIPEEAKGVNAHHIFYRVNYPKLQFNLNNGINLSKKYHYEIHSLDRKVGNY